MLPKSKRNTNIGVFVGFILQGGGKGVFDSGDHVAGLVGLVIILTGIVVFIWGCSQYAKGKGYSGYFGLLGLLSIIGLIVLVFMPDKYKDA